MALTLAPKKRSNYKEYTCDILKLYCLPFKSFFVKNVSLIFHLDLNRWPLPWYYKKVIPQGVHMWNIISVSLTIQKLGPMLKVLCKI